VNNIIDAKKAAEKLTISELRAFRSWVADRIGQLERQAKYTQKNTLTSEEVDSVHGTIKQLKELTT
jgi:hypothetical protein